MLFMGTHTYYNKYKIDDKCLYEYLIVYLIIHKIINKFDVNLTYINALYLYNSAFHYHIKHNWDSKLCMQNIIDDFNNNKLIKPIIKITRNERKYINNKLKFNINNKLLSQPLDVIISSYNDPSGLTNLLDILSNTSHHIRCYIYEKGNFNYNLKTYKFPIEIKYLKNIGREQHTYLYHIINHYDDLQYNILMTPSNIQKYNRFEIITNNIDLLLPNICGIKTRTLSVDKNFILKIYNNIKTCNSEINLEEWSKKILNKFNPQTQLCLFGVLFTTKDNILINNLQYYINIINQFKCDNDTVGHYLERLMSLTYS